MNTLFSSYNYSKSGRDKDHTVVRVGKNTKNSDSQSGGISLEVLDVMFSKLPTITSLWIPRGLEKVESPE